VKVEASTEIVMVITDFWGMTSFGLMDMDRCFEEMLFSFFGVNFSSALEGKKAHYPKY
jgi:hypothetical protein